MAKHNETGKIGENVASIFLERNGFGIICRNYRKKWGEIDIVAEKDGTIHFVEVKTVTRKFAPGELADQDGYRPEDNMHPWKQRRLQRAIQTYLLERYRTAEPKWQFDLACVFLEKDRRVAKVRFMENLIL